jgi:predicted DNA-binding transcriptional regulator YafY
MTTQSALPYGIDELDPVIACLPGDPDQIRCFVRGCPEFVRRPTHDKQGEACPSHGIRCHFSRGGGTYSYPDAKRNLVVAADLAASRVFGHPFKYESDRFGLEKSEDALTWNVFRSFQQAKRLHILAQMVVPKAGDQEPELYLWGLRCSDDAFEPWNLLVAARQRFESNLPVERPLTEPDIALFLPGRYLILIEAKFTSGNSYYPDGPRKDAHSLTKHELIEIYQDRSLRVLNLGQARSVKPTTRRLSSSLSAQSQQILADAEQLIAVLDLKLVDHSRSLDVIRTIQAALLERKQVTGLYASPYQSKPTRLQLHPYRLCLVRHAWYLIARPTSESAPKTYRVARFRSLRKLDKPASVPEAFSLREYFGNAWSVFRGEPTFDVEILFTADAAVQVAETEWHPTQRVERHADGSVTLRFRVDGLEEIIWWLLGWTGFAKVVKPIELRERLVDQLKQGLAVHEHLIAN